MTVQLTQDLKVSTITMKTPFVAEWLKILRNPESKKEKSKLQNFVDKERRCCLGHLCHAVGAIVTKSAIESERYIYHYKDTYSSTFLPLALAELLDVSTSVHFKKRVKYEHYMFGNLSSINDESGATLSEIADIIEKNIKSRNILSYKETYLWS